VKMNRRATFHEQLSAYMDGELSESDARRLEQAIQDDAELAKELGQLRATRELVRNLPRRRAPEDFAAGVLERAARQRLLGSASVQMQSRPLQWGRYLAAAAVLLIAAGIGAVIVATLWSPSFEDRIAATGPGGPTDRLAMDLAEAPADPDLDEGSADRKSKSGEAMLLKALKEAPSDGSGPTAMPAPSAKLTDERKKTEGHDRLEEESSRRALAEAGKVEINTDDLPATRRDVEKALLRNAIRPLELGGVTVDAPSAPRGGQAGTFHAEQIAGDKVQYAVFAAPQQLSQLKAELDVIRAKQRVSQAHLRRYAGVSEAAAPRRVLGGRRRALSGTAGGSGAAPPTQPSERGQRGFSRLRRIAQPASQRAAGESRPMLIMLNLLQAEAEAAPATMPRATTQLTFPSNGGDEKQIPTTAPGTAAD